MESLAQVARWLSDFCFALGRQEQLRLRQTQFEADSFDKGTAQGELTGGYPAEIPLGKACYLV
uniref:Uncharacterized protein n=1 Tax=viral metagenome TaxID=1070528 RepID=A0A6H1Z7J6_9ZZZZ